MVRKKHRGGLWRITGLAAFVAAMLTAASCGGGSGNNEGTPVVTGPQGEVQTAIRQMANAYNARDIPTFLSFFTDAGLNSRYHLTRTEAPAILPAFMGVPPISVFSFLGTTVTDTTAEADLLSSSGQVPQEEKFTLVKEAGSWKIDGYTRIPGHNASGAVAVAVSLREFEFNFDHGLIKDGQISFKFTAAGQQRHEIILDRIPAGLDLNQALAAGTPPAGAEPISFLGIAAPSEVKRMVFGDPLAPGRYVFLCFMPDANDPAGKPHVLKGMHAEFTVPPEAASPTPAPSP